MSGFIGHKVPYSKHGITITVSAYYDDSGVRPNDECYNDGDRLAWQLCEWEFVTLVAKVIVHGIELGRSVLGSVEHGSLHRAELDALEWTPPGIYGGAVTIAGSHAWEVASEALGEALINLDALIGTNDSLVALADKLFEIEA